MAIRDSVTKLVSGIALPRGWKRNPRVLARMGIGGLLALNVAAALWAFKPWAGSAADLEQRASSLAQQIRAKEKSVERLSQNLKRVETARAAGDEFLGQHILEMRTVSSTLANELDETARKANIKPREARWAFEPVEGSEDLSRTTINAYYEGTYADLMHFVNLLDRSPRFLVVESLSAAPQQNGLTLNINLKINAFVRDDGSMPPAAEEEPEDGPASERAGL